MSAKSTPENSSIGEGNASFEQIWQVFAELERTEKLIEWSIGGIYIWPLLRDRLFREVAENLGVFEKRVEVRKPKDVDLAPSAVSAPKRSEFAVFPFLRRNSQGGDPFSQPVIDGLRSAGIDPLVIGVGESDLGQSGLGESNNNEVSPHIDALESAFLARYRNLAKLALAWPLVAQLGGAKHFAKYQRLIDAIESQLGATGQFQTFPRWLLIEFWAQRRGWQKFFKSAGVRKVFVVNAWKRALIAGAQSAGARVVELQHGVLSDRHPLLSWPKSASVAYLPNELYLWGEFWARETGIPDVVRKSIIVAPSELARVLQESAGVDAASKAAKVLVVSQVQQTTKLFQLAVQAAEANPKLEFQIKPHPQETAAQFEAEIAKLPNGLPKNLTVLGPESSALELIPGFEFVVGVHSMALIEAIKLGSKVIVVQLEGWQYVEKIASRGDVTVTPPATDLVAELAKAKSASDPDFYFAPQLESAEFVALLQEKP